jgi:hypothetical protein
LLVFFADDPLQSDRAGLTLESAGLEGVCRGSLVVCRRGGGNYRRLHNRLAIEQSIHDFLLVLFGFGVDVGIEEIDEALVLLFYVFDGLLQSADVLSELIIRVALLVDQAVETLDFIRLGVDGATEVLRLVVEFVESALEVVEFGLTLA